MTRYSTLDGGEEDLIAALFAEIGTTNRVAVEFGAYDGVFKSNTLRLRQDGWRVLLLDSRPRAEHIIRARITAQNINKLFRTYDVPQDLDLLSIDIDGNDLWVWEALTFAPRVVVIEYNDKWPAGVSKTIPYNRSHRWDGSDYFGASFTALRTLGARKGYGLYAVTRMNLVFGRAWPEDAAQFADVLLPHPAAKHKHPDRQRRQWVSYP